MVQSIKKPLALQGLSSFSVVSKEQRCFMGFLIDMSLNDGVLSWSTILALAVSALPTQLPWWGLRLTFQTLFTTCGFVLL